MLTALSGLRVIDLGQWIAAPYSAALFGDFGADVIKVEKPRGGDDQRHSSPFVDGQGAFFNLFNRNKRSVVIDLTTEEGRNECRDLIATADIVIENYRPGAMARMGLDYETLRVTCPRLIYCSISGFGQTGPSSTEGGFDLVIQAMSGLASVCGPAQGMPHRLPIPIVDVSTALFATIGILTALAARERTGEGQYVDVSLLESALAMAPLEVAHYLATGENPERMGQASRNAAPYQLFSTEDGAIALGAAAQHLWEKACDLIGCPELKSDERFVTNAMRISNNEVLVQLMEQSLSLRSTEHWLKVFGDAHIPVGPVLTYEEILNHPQVMARKLIRQPAGSNTDAASIMVAPISFSGTPVQLAMGAPKLGEHTEEVLIGLREA